MKRVTSNRRRRNSVMFALAAVPLAAVAPARGGNKTYNSTSSTDWSNGSNWIGGEPNGSLGDSVNMSGGANHTVLLNVNYTSGTPLGTVTVDDSGGFTNTLNDAAFTLYASGQETVGVAGIGLVNQSGGSVNIINGNALDIGFGGAQK